MQRKIVVPFIVSVTVIIVTFLLFKDIETYFVKVLNKASDHPLTYALISFLVLTADIVLPVPSSIVMFINGFVLGAFGGFFISFISVVVGAIIGYYFGKLTSMGSKHKLKSDVDNIVNKYGAIAILISRGIPILSESICIVCGYNKMPIRQYIIANVIGYLPICILYAICGSIGYDKNTFLLSFACSVFISILFWFLGRRFFSLATKD